SLWAAHKAVVRGTLIEQATRLKKQKLKELEHHITCLKIASAQHKIDPSLDKLAQIQTHQRAIKTFMAKDSKKALLWTKQLFYDKSNKADSLLARKLRQKT
ncbi:Hypothetical predicted protein, partial [Pelobates cultripes]